MLRVSLPASGSESDRHPRRSPAASDGEPALLLLLGAVRHDQRRRHRVGVDDAGEAHPAVGQLLNDADVGQQVEAEPAVLLGDGDAEEPELAHLRDDRVGEGVGALELGGDGDDLARHEAAHGLDDLGPDVLVGRVGSRATHAPKAFLTAITIHFVRVDAESQFGEECFPMATGLMHHGLESAAHRYPDHPAVLAGDERWTFGELDRAANAAGAPLRVTGRRGRRPRGGHDVEPSRVRRGRPRRSASSAPPPCC